MLHKAHVVELQSVVFPGSPILHCLFVPCHRLCWFPASSPVLAHWRFASIPWR